MNFNVMHKMLLVGLLLAAFLAACSDENSSIDNSDGDADASENENADIQGDGDGRADGDRDELENEAGDGETEGNFLKRLHAKGTDIVNENGNVVVLKGANLGGWTYHETWITAVDYSYSSRAYVLGHEQGIGTTIDEVLKIVGPGKRLDMSDMKPMEEWLADLEAELSTRIGVTQAQEFMEELQPFLPGIFDDSDKPLFNLLEERFGVSGRDEVNDAWLGAWIREADIRWLSEQGFNLVRVPMGYRGLMAGSHLDKPATMILNESTISHLHTLLDWCDRYGVYAVLDIQEAPGGQNSYSGKGTLYEDEAMQELTLQLWAALSKRFKDRDAVAAYSLLAEPMDAPSHTARDEMYDRIVKIIRENGDDHLCVIHDGFEGMASLPDPTEYNWTNVIYSTHLFEWNADAVEDYEFLIDIYEVMFTDAQTAQNVPYFIGSFSGIKDEDWAYQGVDLLTTWFNSHHWSWSLWTLKRIDDPIYTELWDVSSAWGLLGRLNSDLNRPDIYRDDLETLKQKIEDYKDIDLLPNEMLLTELKEAL